MFEQIPLLFVPIVVLSVPVLAGNVHVELENDGPIVKGGTIHFTVTVYEGNDISDSESLKYSWEDDGIPQHTRETDLQNATDSWTVTYNASVYPAGFYLAQVTVTKCILTVVCFEYGSARKEFEITETLNGNIVLWQKNETRKGDYVSNSDVVIHEIDLKKSDYNYIITAPTILTYWFVDCTYYGITNDFKFPFNYTKPEEEHFVEALIMADFTPLPPSTTVAPSTTTSTTAKPTSTTSKPSTTSSPTTASPSTTTTSPSTTTTTSTTLSPKLKDVTITARPDSTTALLPTSLTTGTSHSTLKVDTSTKHIVKRSVNVDNKNITSRIMVNVNGTLVPYNVTFPYICNGTEVATDPNKSYGYFIKAVKVKAPISKVKVTGTTWIEQGNLLSLKVNCTGSKIIEYCVKYEVGIYNATGNETCFNYDVLDTCDFAIKRYLRGPQFTVLIIIRNEVSAIVTPVAIQIYKVNKQGQLSVIVVPVAFSLVAVVLIVFGVAYYVQNRSRFVIEVADFNFGQLYSDMEYKTFRERLKDSIVNAFTRGPSPSSSEVPVWPPGRKYGSMT